MGEAKENQETKTTGEVAKKITEKEEKIVLLEKVLGKGGRNGSQGNIHEGKIKTSGSNSLCRRERTSNRSAIRIGIRGRVYLSKKWQKNKYSY